MGSRTYSEDWDALNVWRHIGYPSDLAGAEQPSYERDISLDGRNDDTAREIWHRGDVSGDRWHVAHARPGAGG
jgi:hypothetical protein